MLPSVSAAFWPVSPLADPQGVHELLSVARELLSNRSRWCRTVEAIAIDGDDLVPCFAASGTAVAMDANGALEWASGGYRGADLLDAQSRLHSYAFKQGFLLTCIFNDHPSTSHADILAMYDEAIRDIEKDIL